MGNALILSLVLVGALLTPRTVAADPLAGFVTPMLGSLLCTSLHDHVGEHLGPGSYETHAVHCEDLNYMQRAVTDLPAGAPPGAVHRDPRDWTASGLYKVTVLSVSPPRPANNGVRIVRVRDRYGIWYVVSGDTMAYCVHATTIRVAGGGTMACTNPYQSTGTLTIRNVPLH